MGLSTGLSPSSWLEEIPAAFESSDYVPLLSLMVEQLKFQFTYWVGGLVTSAESGFLVECANAPFGPIVESSAGSPSPSPSE
jgi:hypothetical protein